MKETHASSKRNLGNSTTPRRSQCGAVRGTRVIYAGLWTMALCLALSSVSLGQQEGNSSPAASSAMPTAASPVPRLIKFSGELNPQITQITQNKNNEEGKNQSAAAIAVTFSLYELPEGGSRCGPSRSR